MQTMRDEGYTVISLRALTDALAGGRPVPARSVLTEEVTGSRKSIERELGTAPDFFAYPLPT